MNGEVLGNRYELHEKIGEGGMAIVYKAKDTKLNRFVAIKILKKEFADNEEIAQKFKREATAIANLSHANIVNVLDVGHEEEGNIDYFVMEYVNGKTLKELIVYNGKLSYSTAITIAIQISKALECAHASNIIHRDVKPQNILVTESGEVKVTDFGIAKSSTSATITNTTTIMGSAHYLSPEQAKGTFVDLRTDIYSLGIVLYEMVTGRLPFDGESPVTIALKHIQEDVVPPKKYNQSIPESVNTLILKTISKEPVNRYQNCKELIVDLERIKDNPDVIINKPMDDIDGRTIVMAPITSITEEKKGKITNSKAKFDEDLDDEYDDDYEDENEDEDEERTSKKSKRKNRSKKPLIIGIIAVIVLLGAFGVGALMFGGVETEIKMPNIVDKSFDDAKKQLQELGLNIEIVETKVSDKPEKTILESTPKVDETLKKGDTVTVVVSGGVEKVKVPDLRDYDVNYIKQLLTQRGLKYEINEEFNDDIDKGILIKQSPERDTEVEKDTTIYLTISKGPEIKEVDVPNYISYKYDDAKKALDGLNLVVDAKTKETNNKDEDGIVLDQSPKGGKLKEGDTVQIYYGKYVEPPVEIIEMKKYLTNGMTLKEAVNNLTPPGIGYEITGVSETIQDMSLYKVTSFTEKIKKGEKVTLVVEKIKEDKPTDTEKPPEEDTGNSQNSQNTHNP